ncbi:Polysaccharide pyruvyl transferase [[Clostridium] aminophilum]|uniref:Polysaccharide pyruvyl transferase n=1 Tax=[Clostridium] aminophilum TaxID=1526 RepID=A0A1I0B8A5_9FIRM|nr:polysaccharide pyruvyl transferase family protein [[Clostridium] aminophilum]SET02281.1 Polysaccharide pyruvyl transferase [[Clostridium] aminophilum]
MIGIITVFYSENFGSVLQAYALHHFLNENGYDNVFISTRNKYSSHSFKKMIFSFGNQILHGQCKNALYAIQRYRYFDKVLKCFPHVQLNPEVLNNIDLFIVGSDTVWDVDSKYFRKSSNIFWATDLPGDKIIAYAPSVANSTVQKMNSLSFPRQTLDKIFALSARDSYTFSVMRHMTNKPIEFVCDPTILLGSNGFQCFMKSIDYEKYVAVYLFEKIGEEEKLKIQDFAKRNDLILISIGKVLPWCDISVDPSIENFISYIANSKYVITNTFHGIIFSILYEKSFLFLGYNKKKVTELLGELDLDHRVPTKAEDITSIMNDRIDYTNVNRKISEIRQRSKKYLLLNINKGLANE